jgi:rsbT co-antagonist protein RsbR
VPTPSARDQATEVTPQEWERRKAFAGFTAEDAQLLRELRPAAEACADEVVDGLYRHFLRFEETKAFFQDEATLDRVKALQKHYFLGLTQGEYGEAYLAHRLHVGRVHQRINLPPRWYLGAYSIYQESVSPHVLRAFGADRAKAQRAFLALLKLMTLDQELAMTAYIAAAEVVSRAQEILEVSTPVMQLWEGVVAAPLIGTLDSQRTQLFMERLLQRIVETGSAVALVDITGVPTVDTRTAQHLIDIVAAVRLLGAQVVLTGLRPAIAQTLVHLGIDLSHVVTRTSLAGGLRYALETLRPQVTAAGDGQSPGKEW